MLIGKENVLAWLEFNDTPYWRIKNGSGESAGLIFKAQRGEEPLSLTDGKAKLTQALNQMAPGNYFIEAHHTLGEKKNWNKTSFQITNENGQVPQQHISGLGGHSQTDVVGMINDALEKERTKNKVERLEADCIAKDKRIKELEAELDSSMIRIEKRASQILGLGDWFGTEKTAETVSTSQIGNIEDDTERIGALMEKWATKDPEFEGVLTGIVNLAYNNPAKYSMGKKMLK